MSLPGCQRELDDDIQVVLTQERKERQPWLSRGAVGEDLGLGSSFSRDTPDPLASTPGWLAALVGDTTMLLWAVPASCRRVSISLRAPVF